MDDAHVGRAPLAGVSIGGYALFEFWRRHRGRVAALGLFNTKAPADSAEARAGRLQAASDVLERGTEPFFESMVPRLLGKTTRETRPDLVEGALRMMRKMSPEDVAQVQRGMAERPDSVDTLKTINVPTLLVTGDEDILTGMNEAELMRQHISGSQLRVIPKAGHYSAWEQPEEAGRLLRQFLDGLLRVRQGIAASACYNFPAMIDTVLVAEKTVVSAKGDGPTVDVSGAASRVFLLTLEITKIIEQESLDVSINGSADGAAWGAKALVSFPQKFYCGQSPLLLDLTAHPDVKFVRAHWEVGALGARHGDADVRVRREAERNSRGRAARGHGRGQGGARVVSDQWAVASSAKLNFWLDTDHWSLTTFAFSFRYIDSKMKSESQVIVRPARNVRGSVSLPGDKSISHRYAMLAAIADGPSRLENYSTGADCASTLGCLRSLGVKWERKDGADNVIEVQGSGLSLTAPSQPLDCGNSGSTIRMLSGILAGQQFTSEMAGDESLSRRPMERVIMPLTAMGAQITSQNGRPPLAHSRRQT